MLLTAITNTRRIRVVIGGFPGSRGDSLAFRARSWYSSIEDPDAPLRPMLYREFFLGDSGFALTAFLVRSYHSIALRAAPPPPPRLTPPSPLPPLPHSPTPLPFRCVCPALPAASPSAMAAPSTCRGLVAAPCFGWAGGELGTNSCRIAHLFVFGCFSPVHHAFCR